MRYRWTRLSVLAAGVAVALSGGSAAQAADTNVALNAVTTTAPDGNSPLPAAQCTLGSGSSKAVDGHWSNIYTDKWCVPSGNPILEITLPPVYGGYKIDKVVVMNAGIAGENPLWNTRNYSIDVRQFALCGTNGPFSALYNPTVAAVVTNNTANQTVSYVNADHVGAVQLWIGQPNWGAGGATRIYEVQVWGTPTSDTADQCWFI